MRLLVLDAALGPCSAALVQDGHCLGLRHGPDLRAAETSLAGMVRDLLDDHGSALDAIAVTVGPGSFTGLRGALALAHGLSLGSGAGIVGVTVAEAFLAVAPPSRGRSAWVALDSRRAGRVFLQSDGMAAVPLDALPMPAGAVEVLGDAAAEVVAALRLAGADAVTAGSTSVSAMAVASVALRRLAGDLPPCPAQPLYVEPPEARAAPPPRPVLA